MNKQIFLKALLILQTIALAVYTLEAFNNEGTGLLNILIANIKALNWNGQFNIDFLCYLIWSGLWIMWRNRFSITSIVLASVASVLGTIIFAPYLLYLLFKENGDLKKVLIGDRR